MTDLNQIQGSNQVVAPDPGQPAPAPSLQGDGQNLQLTLEGQAEPQPVSTPESKPVAFELEPVDQSERSQLGRRVKKMETEQQAFMRRMEEYMASLQGSVAQQNTPENTIVSTAADVKRVLEEERRRETQGRQRYQNDFLSEVQTLGDENPDLHAEITREMFEVPNSPFNQIKSGDPISDAQWNYSRAMKAVLAKKYANPRMAQQGVRPNAVSMNTGVPVGTRTQTSAQPPIVLDEHAALFARKMGLPVEKVQKYLSQDPNPINRR